MSEEKKLRDAFRAGHNYATAGNCYPNDNGSLPEDEYIKSLELKHSSEQKIREIIKRSELYYTASKIIDSESFEMMFNELVEKLSSDNH